MLANLFPNIGSDTAENNYPKLQEKRAQEERPPPSWDIERHFPYLFDIFVCVNDVCVIIQVVRDRSGFGLFRDCE